MPISGVSADDPVQASTMNAVIARANAMTNRAVITATTNWSVPAGVNAFRVTLCGGGGGGGAGWYDFTGEGSDARGGRGGTAPLISAIYRDIEVGTTFAVTIGAGGTSPTTGNGNAGGSTSFGTGLISAGGPGGVSGSATAPVTLNGNGHGTATFPAGQPNLYHINELYTVAYETVNGEVQVQVGYGRGGEGGFGGGDAGNSGRAGICIIEW